MSTPRRWKTLGGGVFMPLTFAHGLANRWPEFFGRMATFDRYAGRFFPGTWLNDHYLAIFERTEEEVRDV